MFQFRRGICYELNVTYISYATRYTRGITGVRLSFLKSLLLKDITV